LLPDHVANQIAAGRGCTKTLSVKELLENAVDAKATDIKLVIKMLEKHWFRLLTMVWE
jgi:DNA mismatch repair protein MutL